MANENEDSSKEQGKRTIAGSLQGYEFQTMLTLSTVIKAGVLMRQDDEFQCTIAWEDATAGKFDDATFRCTYRDVENILNIQAKNRMAAQPIEWSEFMGEAKKDFSLVTYFHSFRILKRHHGDDLDRHQLVLCTNSDLTEEIKQTVEKVNLPEAIDIFSSLGASCYRFTTRKLRAAGKFDSIKSLLRNCSDSYCLAHLLAETISKEKELDLSVNNPQRAKLVYTYKLPLRKFVVGECRGKGIYDVHDNYITGSGLSAGVVLFRKDFEQAYQSLNKELVNIWDDVKTKGIKLKTNKQGKINEQTTKKDDQCDNLPTDTVTDEDIATFFRLFIIVAKADDLPAKITTLLGRDNVFGLSATQLGSGEMDIAYKYAYSMIYDWMKQQSDLPTKIRARHVRRLLKKIGLRIRYLELKFLGSNYLDSRKDKKLCHSQEHLRSLPLREFLHAPESTEHRPLTAFPFYSRYNPEFAAWIVFETMRIGCNDMDPLEICFIDATKQGGARAVQDVLCQVDLSLAAIITCADKRAVEQLVREINETIAALEQTSRVPNKKLVLVAQITANEADTQVEENSLLMEHLSQEALGYIVPEYAKMKLFGIEIPLIHLMQAHDDVAILLYLKDLLQDKKIQEILTERYFQRVPPWYIEREFEVVQTPNTKAFSQYSAEMGEHGSISSWDNEKKKGSWHEFASVFYSFSFLFSDIWKAANRPRKAMLPLLECEKRSDDGPYGKVHILLEDAGFGKSIYLSWLGDKFQRANPSLWVIRFNSNDYSTDFQRLSDSDWRRRLTDTEAVRFLYQMTHLALFLPNIHLHENKETDREREVARQVASLLSISQDKQSLMVDEEKWKRMQWTPLQLIMARFFAYQFNNRTLVILLDGFDEIIPYYTGVVIDLLTRFQSFGGIRALYITSRPHKLREKFGAVFKKPTFYQLEPFSDADIVRMVHIFMSHEFEAYHGENRDVEDLLKGLSAAINLLLGSFSEIPLYIGMALDVLKPLIEKYVDFSEHTIDGKFISELKTTFEPLTLMQTFFDNKILRANIEKVLLSDSASHTASAILNRQMAKKHAEEKHSVLALYVLVDETERKRLLPNDEQAIEYLEEVRAGKEKSGIIEGVVGNQPIFIHRTFAEYFAARWLCRNRESEQVRNFLRMCYMEDHRKEMLGFFDKMLLKERGSTAAKLLGIQSPDVNQLLRQEPDLLQATDAGGRTIVHLMVLHYTIKYLESDNLGPHLDLNAKDKLLQWSALDYALARQSDEDVICLLRLGADIETLLLINPILSLDAKSILPKALQYEKFLREIMDDPKVPYDAFASFISELPTRATHCLIVERKLDLHSPLLEQDGIKLTPLQYCVVNGQVSMVKAMVKQGGGFDQVLASDVDSLVVKAFEFTTFNVLQYLLVDCRCVVPADVGDDALVNALDKSISRNKNELFKALIKCFCKRKSINYTEHHESDTEEGVDRFYDAICYMYNLIDRTQVVDPASIDPEVLRLMRLALKSKNLYAAKALVELTELDANDPTYPLIVEGMQKCKIKPFYVQTKCEEAVILLIKITNGLDATDAEGRTLLHIALANSCFRVAEYLVVQKGAQLLQIDKKNRWNAFHYCLMEQSWWPIELENRELKKFFERMMEIEPFACITSKDALGRNGLHLAIVNRHYELALLILEKSTQAVAPHERRSRLETLLAETGVDNALLSILEGSISLHRKEVFQALIECFCRQKSLSYTEYHLSDTEKDVERFYEAICFTYNLIDREDVIDPASIDQDVLRLLRCALNSKNLYAAKALMQLAELDANDLTYPLIVEGMQECNVNDSPIRNQCEETLILLIDTSNGLDATDAEGRTLLHIALENECFLVAEHLVVQKGAQLLQTDKKNRWNAFHYCLKDQNLWCSKTNNEQVNREQKKFFERMMEIEPFACITAKDVHGRNGLHLAIVNGHHEIALLILEKNTQAVAPHERRSRWETLLTEAGVVRTEQHASFMRTYENTLKQ